MLSTQGQSLTTPIASNRTLLNRVISIENDFTSSCINEADYRLRTVLAALNETKNNIYVYLALTRTRRHDS